ncbi:MAG: haloacid dehalogenase-like hydrolase [Clostridiales bacterium]|nr:haloacid dehalogenase-like hydrolase [Clostridiales bacterium]
MKIDVFDFDGTIYDGDSTVDFLLFCFGKKPVLALFCLPPLLRALGGKFTGHFSLTSFKSDFFSVFARRLSLGDTAEEFWRREKTKKKLGKWFLSRKRTLPVVIASASPDFELTPAARLLRADALICTRCDPGTGRVIGKNCKSAEKIERIRKTFGEVQVRSMYTDDPKADGPLLSIAEERYLVRHGTVERIS